MNPRLADRFLARVLVQISYGTGDFDAGRFACDRLRSDPETPLDLAEHTRRNQCFYTEPLEAIASGVITTRLPVAGVAADGEISVDAPALCVLGDRLLALIRVGLGDSSRWIWTALEPDGLPTDHQGVVASALGFDAGVDLAGIQLSSAADRVTASGVAWRPGGGPPVMALVAFDPVTMTLGPAMPVGDPDPGLWTGAWSASWIDDEIVVLPALGPTGVFVAQPDGALRLRSVEEAPRAADALHAAAPLVEFGSGYLTVAREFMVYPGGPSFDLSHLAEYDPYGGEMLVAHRFVAFDRSLRMTGLSHPFVFSRLGRELCGGIAVSGERVVLAWALDGQECWTTSLPASQVERLLSGIDSLQMTGPFLGGPSMTGPAPERAPVAAAAAYRRSYEAAMAFGARELDLDPPMLASWFAALQPPPDLASSARISILLPTRGRPEPLARSIASLLDTALRPDAVEILLAVDTDDAPTIAALPGLPAQVRSILLPRRGYARLHEYMNLLARLASGYWTMMWNDDDLMVTRGWDEIISREPDCIAALICPQHRAENVTPVMPRHWLALLGHYSLQVHNDTWLERVADEIGVARVLEVEFIHDRADFTGNNDDATFQERVYSTDELNSEENRALIRFDARSLEAWIAFERSLIA